MEIFTNQFLIQNIQQVISFILASFFIALLITPIVGMVAKRINAVDLPARDSRKSDRGLEKKIHNYAYPRLGGLGAAIAFFTVLMLTGSLQSLPLGIIIGVLVIIGLGIADDIYNLSAPIQFGIQFLAAFIIVFSGISITQITIFNSVISFDWLPDFIIQIGRFTYNFVFPGDILTIFWIVGLINVVNWVGGVDALNATISGIALTTILILVLSTGNIPLALVIAIYLGGILGVLPYNWNPGKIMYGSVGDYLNGYLLAVFAIIGGLKWNATLILLAIPIIDGIIVIITRWKNNPQLRKTPLKLISLSGYNHLHHKILAAGYSKKMVVLIEGTFMLIICTVVLLFSDSIQNEYLSVPVALSLILVVFTIITYRAKKSEKLKKARQNLNVLNRDKTPVIVTTIEKEEKEQKYIY